MKMQCTCIRWREIVLCFGKILLWSASRQGMFGCFVNNSCKSSPLGAVNVLVLEKFVHNRDRALAWDNRDWP